VTAVIPPGDGRLRRTLDAEGIPVVASPFDFDFRPKPSMLVALTRLRAVIRSTQPDVVFYHLYASALAARLTTWGSSVRRVHMVAGPLYLDSTLIRRVERVLMRLDTQLIAGSEHTANRYRALGLGDDRLTTVPYGVDLDRFAPVQGDRAALGLHDDDFVVVMVAYVYAPKSAVFPGVGIKGHDVLLDAWRSVVASEPRARLLLVGSGFDDEGERHRQRLLREFGVDDDPTVTWLEKVEDVRPSYAVADLSVSPSLSENHGAALEASAMGVPSVVSDAGALPETVTSQSGWTVPAGTAAPLARAILAAADEKRRGSLSERGRQARALMATSFDLERCVESVSDVVLGTTERSRAPGPARPQVAAFSEQRTWVRDGDVVGRKSLDIVSALAARTVVELNVRVGPPEPDGVVLAPGTVSRPLTAGGTGLVDSAIELLRNASRVVRAVRRADVVYADQPGIVGGMGLVAGRLLRRPLVVNVVGDSAESVRPDVVPGLRGRVAHKLLPAVQKWSAGRATVTNYVTQQALQERYPPSRSRQTFALSTASPLGPARPRPFPSSRLSVVTVGSLEQPYKGVHDLIEALALLVDSGTAASLTVVGEGRVRAELEQLAEETVPGRVTFTGQLYGERLHAELGRHDVFVLASWTEGLPRALVEAMADGLPCVATDVGGVRELVEAARMVPPRQPVALAQAIARLVSDPAAANRSIAVNLESAARLFARRDSMDDLVDAVLAAVPVGRIR
jgi:glycosyltransferase involved in cell wall biosynthesis